MGSREGGVLSEELRAWCHAQKLPYVSAEELAMREDLSEVQRAWVEQFCWRWDAFMASDGARELRLKTSLELAGAFVSVLRDVLGEEPFGLCMTGRLAVEDACNSNSIMAAAFMRIHGRDPWMPSDVERGRCDDADLERDCRLWNEAVAICKGHMGRVH